MILLPEGSEWEQANLVTVHLTQGFIVRGGGKSSTDGGDKSALGQEIPRGYQLHTPLHQTSSMADKYLFHTHKISSISLIRFTRVVTHS